MRALCMLAALVAAGCGRLGFDDGATDSGADATTSEITVSERSGASRSGVVDATIKDYEPTNNYHDADFLGAFADKAGAPTLPGILRFDLSSLAGATAVAAEVELALNLGLNTTFPDRAIEARELLESWLGTEVTYTERLSGKPWSSAGASGAARGDLVGSATGSATGSSDRITLPLDASLVQRWIDAPDKNSGVVLIAAGDDGAGVWLCSSECIDNRRPQLSLEIAP